MQRLFLDVVDNTFDSNRDIPIGPWCFQGAEHIDPQWDELDFINPFSHPEEMQKASLYALALYESLIPEATIRFNKLHGLQFSQHSWRHILIGWQLTLIQIAYVRFRHIEKFITQHRDKIFHVRVAPEYVQWPLETSHALSQFSSRADFDYWLSSVIIRRLAPDHWVLEEDIAFSVAAQVKHENPTVTPPAPLSFREKIRDGVLNKIKSGRFGCVYGTTWRSQIFFTYVLNFCRSEQKKNISVLKEKLNPSMYFSQEFLDILSFITDLTTPFCYTDTKVFQKNLSAAHNLDYRAGKIRITTPDIFKEVEKLQTVLAHEAGEHLVGTQHGSWYGTVNCATTSHMAEHALDSFFSWGWDKHDFNGHSVPLPAPLPLRFKRQRKKAQKTSSLLLVDNILNLRSARLSGQPMPADVVRRRHHKKDFIQCLNDNVQNALLYRPHVHHDAGIDDTAYLQKHFKDLNILTAPSMDPALLECKLFVSNHYGTTIHTALAADIPTVCYWDDYPPLTAEAEKYFDLLRAQNILFDCPHKAAAHINAVWDDLDAWWQSESVQKARKDWCDIYARTSPFWVFHWMRALIRL